MTSRPIVFTCNTAFGIANFRGGVMRNLVAMGYRVVAVAPPDPLNVERIVEMGAEFIPWELAGGVEDIADEVRSVVSLVAIYRRLNPAICFHFTVKAVIYGAMACRLLRLQAVSVVTGLGYVFLNDTFLGRIGRFLYRTVLPWSRELWFLNADDRLAFAQDGLIPSVPILIIPGEGIDLERFSPASVSSSSEKSEALTFLMISRLLRDKGVVEYVEAARRASGIRPHLHFQLLGPFSLHNPSAVKPHELKSWVEDGIVDYLGVVDDVRSAISAADCIVLPSYREGLPRAILEAMAMKRPVVATDAPGCRELVIDGESGMLCDVGSASDLADKMVAMADLGDERRAEMGNRGYELVRSKYSESRVITIYLETLERYTG